MKSKSLKYLSMSLLIMSILWLFFPQEMSITRASSQKTYSEGHSFETVDLNLTETINDIEFTIHRTFTFANSWDLVLLNLSVRNYGEALDNVILQAWTNGAPSQARFNTMEQVGLVKAYAYQFEVVQSLIFSLNVSKEINDIILELRILLDHTISWRTPDIDFRIVKTEMIRINPAQPSEEEDLFLISRIHRYEIQPPKYEILEKKLLAPVLLPVSIVEQMVFFGRFTVTLQGTKINYIMINGETFHVNGGSEYSFNSTLTSNSDEEIHSLKFIIAPDYERLTGVTKIVFTVKILGVLVPKLGNSFENVLGSHPIPEWLMIPIIIIGLLGIPWYMVYQEHLKDKDENILDSKQTKI